MSTTSRRFPRRQGVTLSDTRLDVYVQSWGNMLPKDIQLHGVGGSRSSQCVFCRKPHTHIGVIRFQKVGSHEYSEMTDTCMCDRCAQVVTTMEEDFDGVSLREQLFKDLPAYDTKERIRMFVEQLRFDSSVHKHYIGRSEDVYPMQDHCYFCKQIPASGTAFKVQVPVDFDSWLIGGYVLACTGCMLKAKLTPGSGMYAKLSTPLQLLHEERIRTELCPQCNHKYQITLGEWSYRQGYRSIGDHLCPDCAYIQRFKSEPDPVVLPMQAGEDPYQRCIYAACEYCNEAAAIDITVQRKMLRKRFRSTEGKRVCDNCRTYGDHPLFSILDGKGCRIRAYTIAPNRYRVVKTSVVSDKLLLSYIQEESPFDLYVNIVMESKPIQMTM